MPKFSLGMLVRRTVGGGKFDPEFGIVTCAPSENNAITVEVNGILSWNQAYWIPVCTQGDLVLLTERLCFPCSQPQEANSSGKNSPNVRQIGSARRRARPSQPGRSLSSEKKKETTNPTASKTFFFYPNVLNPQLHDIVLGILLVHDGQPGYKMKHFSASEGLLAENELNRLNSLKCGHWTKWYAVKRKAL